MFNKSEFFKMLYGNEPEGYLTICHKTEDDSNLITNSFAATDIDKAVTYIENIDKFSNIYYEVCLQGEKPAKGKRGNNKGAKVMPGVWLDLDTSDGFHKSGEYLPTSKDALEFVENLPMQPTIIVHSGGGYHLYFLFHKPWVFETDEDRENARRLSRNFQAYIINKGKDLGYKIDNTHDLARLLRVPGTSNFKNVFVDKPVTIIRHNEQCRYTPGELEKYKIEVKKSAPTEVVTYQTAEIQPILDNCPWIRHCRDDAVTLSEPEWYAMLSITARCIDGYNLSHEWSRPYPRYNYNETEKKINHALNSSGPRFCKNIQENLGGHSYCNSCNYRNLIKSPIVLGIGNINPLPQDEVYTELTVARRFVENNRGFIRYCYSVKTWYVWNGKHWKEDDTGDITRRMKQTVQSIYAELYDTKGANPATKFKINAEKSSKIRYFIDLARSEPGIPVQLSDFDQNHWLLNCNNGTLDLKTGILKPHNRNDLITMMIPVDYKEDAKCPEFESFLEKILSKSYIGYLKRAIGYSLTGITREQCLFFLYGKGSNGKSTLLSTLKQLLGEYAKSTAFDSFLELTRGTIRDDIAFLKDSRFVIAGEIDQVKSVSESVIKQVTGNDSITTRFLYGKYFEYTPTYKIFWHGNYMPNIEGNNIGINRRIHKIPFNVTIKPNEQDKELHLKLSSELSGILRWAVEGCMEWQRDGLNHPDAERVYEDAYKDEIDWFLQIRCEFSESYQISKDELYREYKEWAGDNSQTKKQFGTRMKQSGLKDKKSGNWYWLGIQLKPKRKLELVRDSAEAGK